MLSFNVGEAIDFLVVPANSKHSISNPGPGKLVAVFFKADRPLPEVPSP